MQLACPPRDAPTRRRARMIVLPGMRPVFGERSRRFSKRPVRPPAIGSSRPSPEPLGEVREPGSGRLRRREDGRARSWAGRGLLVMVTSVPPGTHQSRRAVEVSPPITSNTMFDLACILQLVRLQVQNACTPKPRAVSRSRPGLCRSHGLPPRGRAARRSNRHRRRRADHHHRPPELSVVEEPLPCGQPRDRQAAATCGRYRPGAVRGPGLHRGVFGQSAVTVPVVHPEDPLADGEAGGPVPNSTTTPDSSCPGTWRPVTAGAVDRSAGQCSSPGVTARHGPVR